MTTVRCKCFSPSPVPNFLCDAKSHHPSVNEVFDPERVDDFYRLAPESRQRSTLSNKATNYGVVRPELLDRLYEAMYHQRLHEADPSKWQFKIVPWREVVGFEKDGESIRLRLKNTSNGEMSISDDSYDLAILGTGYERKGHETLLESTRGLLEEERFAVERDYRVKYRKDAVAEGCGVYLQGCCEDTHGVCFVPSPFSPFHSVVCRILKGPILDLLALAG